MHKRTQSQRAGAGTGKCRACPSAAGGREPGGGDTRAGRLDLAAAALRRRAFVRSLEVIGEAAKKVPLETKERLPDVEWRAVAGMRDRLNHRYFGVDYELVWGVVVNKVPVLGDRIRELLEEGE